MSEPEITVERFAEYKEDASKFEVRGVIVPSNDLRALIAMAERGRGWTPPDGLSTVPGEIILDNQTHYPAICGRCAYTNSSEAWHEGETGGGDFAPYCPACGSENLIDLEEQSHG